MGVRAAIKAVLVVGVAGMLVALASCSSKGHASGVANVHRASAVACSTTRAPSLTHDGGFDPNGPFAYCKTDAQCTQGKNGRCEGVFNSAACSCDYDECTVDSDCASGGVCICRSTAFASARNYCATKGNCLTDADCSSGYCSPSLVGDTCNAASIAFFCHTSDDECTNDGDCSQRAQCLFIDGDSHWKCAPYPGCDAGITPLCQ